MGLLPVISMRDSPMLRSSISQVSHTYHMRRRVARAMLTELGLPYDRMDEPEAQLYRGFCFDRLLILPDDYLMLLRATFYIARDRLSTAHLDPYQELPCSH